MASAASARIWLFSWPAAPVVAVIYGLKIPGANSLLKLQGFVLKNELLPILP